MLHEDGMHSINRNRALKLLERCVNKNLGLRLAVVFHTSQRTMDEQLRGTGEDTCPRIPRRHVLVNNMAAVFVECMDSAA